MVLVICPGIHPRELTDSFLEAVSLQGRKELIHLTPCQLFRQLEAQLPNPLTLIAFSAGVVAAIAIAHLWQLRGGKIRALIALDGWGVPLAGNFPIHRLSHDYFTHWSSRLLGAGGDSFYAQPPVTHLDLWRSPLTARGWWQKASGCRTYTNAAQFIAMLLADYEEM